jgi:hypothetical protein
VEWSCRRVEDGWSIAYAAAVFNVAWPTVKRWADRYRAEGPAGMADPQLTAALEPAAHSCAGGAQDRAIAVEAPAGPGGDHRPRGLRPVDRACGAAPVPDQPAVSRRPGDRRADPPLRMATAR